MQEKKSRKEWIKTIAIIFLSVMLVLTFFSNTIRNYSLPEVATQYVYSDSLTTRIRGTGTVESSEPYNVVLKQARKIESVRVRVGDRIEKGQVIYVLEEGESEELKKAQDELEALKTAYDKALITGQISSSDRKAVENGKMGTIDQNLAKIDAAQRKVDQYKSEVEKIEKEIEHWTYNYSGDITEVTAVKEAEAAITAWTIEQTARNKNKTLAYDTLTAAKAELEKYEDVSENDPSANAGEVQAKRSAKAAVAKAQEEYNKCVELCKIADEQLAKLSYKKDSNEQFQTNKLKELGDQLKLAQSNQATAENDLKDLISSITTRMDLNTSLTEIREKEEEIEKIKSEQKDNEIIAPVSGTILTLSRVAGETTSSEETVATIQLAGKGFSLSMSLTNEQAAMINKGDEAEVTNSWYFSDVHAVVESIKPDKDSQGRKKIVTFNVEGESVSAGTQLSLTITSKKTSNYDYVVPNSALRHDNKGDYVYRLVEKSSPLGSRYSVERVDVTILAEDETKSAVNGAFDGWNNYVITTASKPLSDGTLVRLKQ